MLIVENLCEIMANELLVLRASLASIKECCCQKSLTKCAKGAAIGDSQFLNF
jgi:hypothetical protein